MQTIQPISGFPELLPDEQLLFDSVIQQIKNAFQLFGAYPIETPAVERTKTLLTKNTNNKEIYGIHRLQRDNEDETKDIALRFDLTIPLARYVAQHFNKLVFPFSRYQIQPVWRGERTQTGRYRQFYQCDFDVVAHENLPMFYDAQMFEIISFVLKHIGIRDYTIFYNNKKILLGILSAVGVDDGKIVPCIKIIDQIDKIGNKKTLAMLRGIELGDKIIQTLLNLITPSLDQSTKEKIQKLKELTPNKILEQGILEIEELTNLLQLACLTQNTSLSFNIARGLDYYTGMIFETRIDSEFALGSICSGGRYDDLASQFINKKLPGVGISVGISRLFYKLKTIIKDKQTNILLKVLVANMDNQLTGFYRKLAHKLRKSGIAVEIYFEVKKLAQQIKYAEKKQFKWMVFVGATEIEKKIVTIKNIIEQKQYTIKEEELLNYLLRK